MKGESIKPESYLTGRVDKKIKKLLLIAVAILVVLLIVSGIVWGVARTKKPAFLYNALIAGETPVYSLVYVQTGGGAVSYYGQIIKDSHDIIVLKNPGYLDVQQPTKEGEQSQISFRQMKDDFFKPLPEMKIYKNNIVFIQELSVDSPIIEAYKNAK